MDIFMRMVQLQGVLLIYLAVGYFARKKEIITGQSLGSFSSFILNIALPCTIFNSFDQVLSKERLAVVAWVLFWSAAITGFAFVLGKLLFRSAPDSQRPIMRYGAMVSNSALSGIPLVGSVFGAEAVFYASFFTIPVRIMMWSAGVAMFIDAPMEKKIKNVLCSPGIIAVGLGMLRMVFRWRIPGMLDTALQNIGGLTTAMSIIFVGAVLGNTGLEGMFSKNALYLSFIRLIALPLLLLAVMKAAGSDELVTAVCVVLTGMPIGINTVLIARRYDADSEFASKALFVSTIFSLVTTPMLTLLL